MAHILVLGTKGKVAGGHGEQGAVADGEGCAQAQFFACEPWVKVFSGGSDGEDAVFSRALVYGERDEVASFGGFGERIDRVQLEESWIKVQKGLGSAFRNHLEAYREEARAGLHRPVAVVGNDRYRRHRPLAAAEHELRAVGHSHVNEIPVNPYLLKEGVAVLAGGLAEPGPGLAAVGRDVPVAALYL